MTADLAIYAQANTMRMTFDAAAALERSLDRLGTAPVFEGFTGRMAIATDDRLFHEVLLVLSDMEVPLTDIRAAGLRSFREYFGGRAPLDSERAAVYVTMCQEGRI